MAWRTFAILIAGNQCLIVAAPSKSGLSPEAIAQSGERVGSLECLLLDRSTPDIVNPKLIVSSLTHAANSHLARTRVAQKFGIRQQQREEVLKMPAGQKLQSVDLIPQLAHSPCHEQGTGHKLSQQS